MDGTIPQKEEDMYYYGMWIDPVYVHIKVPSHSIEREEMRSLMDGTIPQKEEDIYEHGTCIDPVYIHIKAPPTPYKTIGEQVYDEYMQEQIAGVEYIRSCEFLMNSFERASKKITEIMGKTLFIYPDKEDTYHFGDYECSAELICEMGKNNLGLSIERYKSPDEENGE
jgi:hypothetical protein